MGRQPPSSLLNFDRSALALDAAANGHGVAIAPSYMMDDHLTSGRLNELWRGLESSEEYLFMSWARQEFGLANGSRPDNQPDAPQGTAGFWQTRERS